MDDREKRQHIRATFETVATGYDNPALRFFPAAGEHLAEFLTLEGGERVIDVATGTGWTALALARRLPRGRVTGVDFAEPMLAQARAKAEAAGLDNVAFEVADMTEGTLDAAGFDAATCSFGIFFVEDMVSQLRRIADTVRPGGRVALTCFYESAFSPLTEHFADCIQRYGVEAPAPAWKRIANEAAFADLFNQAGLNDVRVERRSLGYHLSGPEQWWDLVWNAGYRGMVNQLSADAQEAFRREHLAELEDLTSDEGLWLDVDVLFAIGQRGAGE